MKLVEEMINKYMSYPKVRLGEDKLVCLATSLIDFYIIDKITVAMCDDKNNVEIVISNDIELDNLDIVLNNFVYAQHVKDYITSNLVYDGFNVEGFYHEETKQIVLDISWIQTVKYIIEEE